MPCLELFQVQDEEYKKAVLPRDGTPRLVIEAGVTGGWWKYCGENGYVLGLDSFGASAPGDELFAHFGLDVEGVLQKAREMLQ